MIKFLIVRKFFSSHKFSLTRNQNLVSKLTMRTVYKKDTHIFSAPHLTCYCYIKRFLSGKWHVPFITHTVDVWFSVVFMHCKNNIVKRKCFLFPFWGVGRSITSFLGLTPITYSYYLAQRSTELGIVFGSVLCKVSTILNLCAISL